MIRLEMDKAKINAISNALFLVVRAFPTFAAISQIFKKNKKWSLKTIGH